MRLTTARYYTPSGRSIQAKGIVPDITVKLQRPEEEKPEVTAPKMPSEKDLERHLDTEKVAPKEKEKEKPKKEEAKEKEKTPADNQKDRALELLKSWDVFKAVAQAK